MRAPKEIEGLREWQIRKRQSRCSLGLCATAHPARKVVPRPGGGGGVVGVGALGFLLSCNSDINRAKAQNLQKHLTEVTPDVALVSLLAN